MHFVEAVGKLSYDRVISERHDISIVLHRLTGTYDVVDQLSHNLRVNCDVKRAAPKRPTSEVEVRPFEVRPSEVDLFEVCPFEVRTFEVRPDEVRTCEVCPVEV